MNSQTRYIPLWPALTVGVVCLASALSMSAQVQTKTSTTQQTPNVQTHVERGEVVLVEGNDLIVKMEDGSLRHFVNVPDSAKIDVDGKDMGIHDLKPGMKLQRTITTTTTPKTVTTVQTVSGRVFSVMPPNSVILTLEDGTNQRFNIPRGQMFNINGKMTDAWGLQKGMQVSATKVVEEPQVQVERETKLTGNMPTPPPAPPADVPILVAVVVPAPAAPATPGARNELPKTASQLPLVGLLGLLSLAASLGLKLVRSIG
jgi:hypothetical protein